VPVCVSAWRKHPVSGRRLPHWTIEFDMELYQLRSFVAVAKMGHLTRAAEKLHLSQPAISAQIKALENEFELALFERAYSGMTLTPAGERLLTDVERVLDAAQALRNVAKALKGEITGRVRVGTSSDPGFIRIGEFLNAQIERHPLLQVELHQEVTGVAFAKVLDGELDASFYYGDLGHPDMSGLRLRASTYRVAAPAAWSGRVIDASWNELVLLPWIITPSISSHHKLVRALFDKHGIQATELVEADQESVIANLVASGVGLSLIREDLALEKEAAGAMCLWRDERLESTLWFVYLLARKDDPVIRALLGVLRDIWKLAEDQAHNKGQRD
jgi:DNA-binding transcriptional LysR family regulator